MTDAVRVVIVDDHDMVREGLVIMLSTAPDIEVVGQAATVSDAVRVVERESPAVVLLDLLLGEDDGLEVARHLRGAGATVKILVLSASDTSRRLHDALAAGADGYLLKSVRGPDLAEAIRRCAAGETVIGHEFVPKLLEDAARRPAGPVPDITAREREVLELAAQGLSNRAIAEQMGISARTAQKHLENLFKKLQTTDRTELVAVAFRRGLLD